MNSDCESCFDKFWFQQERHLLSITHQHMNEAGVNKAP